MPLGGNFGSNPFFNPNYLPGHYAPQQNQSQPQQQSASLVDIAAEQQADAPQVPAGPATGFRSQAIPEPPPEAPEAPPEETAPPPSSVTPPTTPEPVAGIPDIPEGIPQFGDIDWGQIGQIGRGISGGQGIQAGEWEQQFHKPAADVKQAPVQMPVQTPVQMPNIKTPPVMQTPPQPPIQLPPQSYTWNAGAFAFAAGGMVDPIPGYQRGGHITEDPERLAAKLAEMQAARMSHQADQEAYWADYRRNQEKVPYQKYNRVYTPQGNYRVPAGTGYEYKYTGDMEYPTRGGSR